MDITLFKLQTNSGRKMLPVEYIREIKANNREKRVKEIKGCRQGNEEMFADEI